MTDFSNRPADAKAPMPPPPLYGPPSGQAPPQPAPSWSGYPGAPAAGQLACRLCGSTPAAAGRFRAHQGFIVIMRFLRLDGPFCRDCGLATFRRMTGQTLLLGWWGPLSFFITPVTVLINLVRRGRFTRLAPPQREAHIAAAMPPPLNPGRPVFARPAIIGLVVPVLVLVAVVASINSRSAEAQLGKCVNVTATDLGTQGTGTATIVDCGARHIGRVTSVADRQEQCPEETIGAMEWDGGKVLCVSEDGSQPQG
jgi:hypothetical protein